MKSPEPAGSTESIHLRQGVHGAVIGDDVALLDIDGDGYFCLPGGALAARTSASGDLSFVSGEAALAVTQAGLGTSVAGPPPKTLPPLPNRTVIHDLAGPITMGQIVRSFGVVGDLRRAQRAAGLRPLIAIANIGTRPSDPAAVIREAKAFWRLAPWLPIEGECLVRSAMLMSFLNRSGLSADWVFGVRLWPFSAHCWVQVGDICLNDDIERLAAYTPLYCR